MARLCFYYASMNAGEATMNLRVDAAGRAVASGAQTEIGGNDRYEALRRRHFMERLAAA